MLSPEYDQKLHFPKHQTQSKLDPIHYRLDLYSYALQNYLRRIKPNLRVPQFSILLVNNQENDQSFQRVLCYNYEPQFQHQDLCPLYDQKV